MRLLLLHLLKLCFGLFFSSENSNYSNWASKMHHPNGLFTLHHFYPNTFWSRTTQAQIWNQTGIWLAVSNWCVNSSKVFAMPPLAGLVSRWSSSAGHRIRENNLKRQKPEKRNTTQMVENAQQSNHSPMVSFSVFQNVSLIKQPVVSFLLDIDFEIHPWTPENPFHASCPVSFLTCVYMIKHIMESGVFPGERLCEVCGPLLPFSHFLWTHNDCMTHDHNITSCVAWTAQLFII